MRSPDMSEFVKQQPENMRMITNAGRSPNMTIQ